MGAVPESQVTAFIDKLTAGMPAGEPTVAELLKEAEAILAEGDPAGAAAVYAEVIAVEASNVAALAGLAKCYVATGAIEQAKQTLELVPVAKREEAAVKAVQAAIDLVEFHAQRNSASEGLCSANDRSGPEMSEIELHLHIPVPSARP
eukprot:gene51472-70078_t